MFFVDSEDWVVMKRKTKSIFEWLQDFQNEKTKFLIYLFWSFPFSESDNTKLEDISLSTHFNLSVLWKILILFFTTTSGLQLTKEETKSYFFCFYLSQHKPAGIWLCFLFIQIFWYWHQTPPFWIPMGKSKAPLSQPKIVKRCARFIKPTFLSIWAKNLNVENFLSLFLLVSRQIVL